VWVPSFSAAEPAFPVALLRGKQRLKSKTVPSPAVFCRVVSEPRNSLVLPTRPCGSGCSGPAALSAVIVLSSGGLCNEMRLEGGQDC
jgi:hypothetical protein